MINAELLNLVKLFGQINSVADIIFILSTILFTCMRMCFDNVHANAIFRGTNPFGRMKSIESIRI